MLLGASRNTLDGSWVKTWKSTKNQTRKKREVTTMYIFVIFDPSKCKHIRKSYASALQMWAGNPGARNQAWDPKRAHGPAQAPNRAFFGSQARSLAPGFPGPYGPGPWVPGPYLQGRILTFVAFSNLFQSCLQLQNRSKTEMGSC